MGVKTILVVAWPAFLAACLLELVVFAVVDPAELTWAGGPLGWSRQAVYTVGFFIFWATSVAASLTAIAMLRVGPVPPAPR